MFVSKHGVARGAVVVSLTEDIRRCIIYDTTKLADITGLDIAGRIIIGLGRIYLDCFASELR